jgi:SAM-dependent methyltransferase
MGSRGTYLFEHSWEHERKRLGAIERGDPMTVECLTTIGVAEGWQCLEVGAGAGSIARWLSQRVGPSGRVVATDLEVKFLEEMNAANLEIRRHDILIDPLEEDTFDLVHARKVLEHLPAFEAALRRMIGAARPGGWVLVEDADLLSLFHASCSDVAFFARGYRAFIDTMCGSGYQADLGLHLGTHLRDLGLTDVLVRGWTSEWTGAGDEPSGWRLTFEKIRDRVVAQGRLSSDDADRVLAEIRSPDFRAITGVHFAAWGRKRFA